MKNKFNLVIIGSITRDRIVIGKDNPKEWYAPGGGVYYGAFSPVRMGLKVAVITKLAKKDSSLLKEFIEVGIEVFPSWSKETTEMENIYPDPENPDKRICKCAIPPAPFELKDIPADIEAKIFYITSLIRGEISLKVLKKFSQKGMIALDIQGFMRSFQEEDKEMRLDEWREKNEILSLVDILKVDRAEAEILTGEKNPEKAVRILSSFGPEEILLTYHDGVLVYAQGEIHTALFTGEVKIEGRTGRGDTTTGAYLGQRILGESPGSACCFAAALCSLKMKSRGPFRGNVEDVQKIAKKA